MIRDAASNMKRAMKLSSFDDVDCTAHKLQICIRNGLKSHQDLIDLIEKCKKIVTHFNHSTIAQNDLHSIQERLNHPVCEYTIFNIAL